MSTTVQDDPEKYSLSPAELRAIYARDISPRLFKDVESVEKPTAVVLGGQPGAGKSAMDALVDSEFADRGGIVQIIGDDFRAFLPHYSELQQSDDKMAAFFTDKDSGRLVEMALEDASQRGVNVLVEGTMRNPDVVEKTLRQFRDAGYATDARALVLSR